MHTISESSQSITIKSAQVKSYGGASPPVTIFSQNRSFVINRPPYIGDPDTEAEDVYVQVCETVATKYIIMYLYACSSGTLESRQTDRLTDGQF